jgi:hypothetical protein
LPASDSALQTTNKTPSGASTPLHLPNPDHVQSLYDWACCVSPVWASAQQLPKPAPIIANSRKSCFSVGFWLRFHTWILLPSASALLHIFLEIHTPPQFLLQY